MKINSNILTIKRLQQALEKSWCQETCHLRLQKDYSEQKPYVGQCVVTVLIVQDYFGGKIAHDKTNRHYWNVFEDGTECDLTRQQFSRDTQFKIDEYVARKKLFLPHAQTDKRYKLLKDRVSILIEHMDKKRTVVSLRYNKFKKISDL